VDRPLEHVDPIAQATHGRGRVVPVTEGPRAAGHTPGALAHRRRVRCQRRAGGLTESLGWTGIRSRRRLIARDGHARGRVSAGAVMDRPLEHVDPIAQATHGRGRVVPVTKVPVPLATLQVPWPTVAVFAASVALAVSQKAWAGPALASSASDRA